MVLRIAGILVIATSSTRVISSTNNSSEIRLVGADGWLLLAADEHDDFAAARNQPS
jgi:hypothetical protein